MNLASIRRRSPSRCSARSRTLGLGITFSSMLRFRRVRRLTAIMTQLLTVWLMAVSGVAACPYGDRPASDAAAADVTQARHAAHDMSAAETPRASTTSTASHEPGTPPQHHHHEGGHCDMPCAPSSCGSAGHCSSTASSQPTSAALPRVAASPFAGKVREMPPSLSTAPEPPPPKA